MHLTLKEQATRPAGANFLQQQATFDTFVEEFNNERPRMNVPADLDLEAMRAQLKREGRATEP